MGEEREVCRNCWYVHIYSVAFGTNGWLVGCALSVVFEQENIHENVYKLSPLTSSPLLSSLSLSTLSPSFSFPPTPPFPPTLPSSVAIDYWVIDRWSGAQVSSASVAELLNEQETRLALRFAGFTLLSATTKDNGQWLGSYEMVN